MSYTYLYRDIAICQSSFSSDFSPAVNSAALDEAAMSVVGLKPTIASLCSIIRYSKNSTRS